MIVVKIGGGKQINYEHIASDVAELIRLGQRVVLVHGASATRDEIAEKLGFPTQTITSPSGITSVYSDRQAIDIFLMVYCGLINKRIVASLLKHGVNAVGLSGVDGRLWEAKQKKAVYAVKNGKTTLIRDNFTGKVETMNTRLVQVLLDNEYVPVICPPAISFESEIVNTDGDLATAMLGASLHADLAIFLFEAPGFLKDYKNEKTVMKNITKNEIPHVMQYAQGRMQKKILGAQKALEAGVQKVIFSDGRIEHPIIRAIDGEGTILS